MCRKKAEPLLTLLLMSLLSSIPSQTSQVAERPAWKSMGYGEVHAQGRGSSQIIGGYEYVCLTGVN
jgi:hypothetical protein